MDNIKAVDFFCGIGGVTRGFLDAGFDVLCGIDTDIACKDTYEKNNIRPNGKNVTFYNEDIKAFNTDIINDQIDRNYNKLIVIGCAPCQPFTEITQNLNGRHAERGLLEIFSRKIKALNPDYIFIENVIGLKSPKNQVILTNFINSLKPEFDLNPQVINAVDYGIPQFRKRVILFAKKNNQIGYPSPTHGSDLFLNNYITLEETIGYLPPIKAGERHDKFQDHVSAGLTELSLERMKYQPDPGDTMDLWPDHLKLDSRLNKNYKGHKDVYARLWWDRPSGTLTTKFVSVSNGRFVHPEQNRGLSLLEGLLIQTFPENYKLYHPYVRNCAKQIGNAVPVKLAKAFAKKISEDIRSSIESSSFA